MALASRSASLLAFNFYLASFLSLCHSIWQVYQPSPMTAYFSTLFGGRSNFLTLWGLALTWLVFAINLMTNLKPSIRGTKLKEFQATLNVIALPLESLIALLYWSVMAYDPSLMIPAGTPGILPPPSLDLALHLYPAVFLWLNHLFFAPTLRPARFALIIFAFAYSSWIELCSIYGNSDQFPYPFLTVSSRPGRYMIYTTAVILSHLSHALASSAHRHR